MDKQIFQKMDVPAGAKAHVINEPAQYPYDAGQNFQFKSQGDHFDFVHLFVKDSETFPEQLAAAEKITDKDGMLWVSFPKDPAVPTDLALLEMRQMARPIGLQPDAPISLDDDWWAMRMTLS